jgi:hypothetical protein
MFNPLERYNEGQRRARGTTADRLMTDLLFRRENPLHLYLPNYLLWLHMRAEKILLACMQEEL